LNRTNKPPADNKSIIIVEEIIYNKKRNREGPRVDDDNEKERAKKNNANEARRNYTSPCALPCGTFLMLITRRLLPYVFITHTHTHMVIITSNYTYTRNSSNSKRRRRKKSRPRAIYYSGRRIPLFISSIFFFFAPIFFFGFFAPSGLYFFCAYEYLCCENWKIGEKRMRGENSCQLETNVCVNIQREQKKKI
jgi:hypothetical protein